MEGSSDPQEDQSNTSYTPSKSQFEIGFQVNEEASSTDSINLENDFMMFDEETHMTHMKNMMIDNLPPYVMNCLLAAGFDTPEVIADMITTGEGNDIAIIETYINEEHPGDTSYIHMGAKTCKFPPGHRRCITRFVEIIKNDLKEKNKVSHGKHQIKAKKRKNSSPCASKEKKRKWIL